MNENSYFMFYKCKGLESVDLSEWDTSNVIHMEYMFYYCSNLTSVDLSKWDTSKVITMAFMFQYCSNLKTIYASSLFDTNKYTSESYSMFYQNSLLV